LIEISTEKGGNKMTHLFHLDGWFMRSLSRIVDIFILNALFLIFCLPIVTIGTSFTALYSVSLKMVRDEDSQIVVSFIKAFRKNFKQSTLVWFILLVAACVLFIDFNLLRSLSGILKLFLISLLITFGFIYVCIFLFVFPYMARFEDTIKKTLLNSGLFGLFNIPYLLILLIFNILPIIVMLSSPAGLLSGIYIGTFGGFALLAFLNSYIFRKIFSKYEH
jgi:uncharacterized membrane protein YesL